MNPNIESTRARETAECTRWKQQIDQDFVLDKAQLEAVLPAGGDWAFAGELATVINPWV